jgi:DNA polymerase III delta prime subunit
MSLNLPQKNTLLHHAYCIVGNTDDVVKELETFFKKELDFVIAGNPDFWYGEYDVMSIDDGRKIKELHQNKPTAGNKKIFVVSANFITEQAQNAMLKIFEEPAGDTHFFLVIPSANNLLPTLKSRMILVHHYGTDNTLINAKAFLQSSASARLEEIKKLMKSISDEEESKIEVVKFINALEVELKKQIDLGKAGSRTDIFLEIEKVRQYASEQSPSLKMILEHIALMVPFFS